MGEEVYGTRLSLKGGSASALEPLSTVSPQ